MELVDGRLQPVMAKQLGINTVADMSRVTRARNREPSRQPTPILQTLFNSENRGFIAGVFRKVTGFQRKFSSLKSTAT